MDGTGDYAMTTGGEPLGSVGHGVLTIQQVADTVSGQSRQLAASAKQLLISAQSGGFGFQPEAAGRMIEALQVSVNEIHELRSTMDVVTQAPRLGHTPVAHVVAPFTQLVATDHRGIVQAIDTLQQVLVDMIAAYQEATRHYDENETIAAQHMRQQHR